MVDDEDAGDVACHFAGKFYFLICLTQYESAKLGAL
jgi:hypothetical protein